MKHFIVFYYILSFTAGLACIISASNIYMITKKSIAKKYLIFLIFLTITVVTNTFYFYIFSVIQYRNTLLEIFFTIIFFICEGGLIYIIPSSLHELTGKPFSGIKKILFGSISCMAVVMLFLPYFISQDQDKLYDIICFELYSIYMNIFYLVIIYALFFIAVNLKKVRDHEIKKFLKTILILGILFFPAFLLDGSWRIFQVKLKLIPKNFNFVPLFYLVWSIFSLLYSVNDFFIKVNSFNTNPGIEPSADFLDNYDITGREKDVLSMIIKGMNYNEISDILFISPGTIKNYTYNIYKKTGVNNKVSLINMIQNFNKNKS